MMGFRIYWTDNGGESWNEGFQFPDGIQAATDIFFLNANVGYLTFVNNKIYKTTDGGKTWKQLVADSGFETGATNGIWFFDEQNGIVGGTKGIIYRTTDGGKKWVKEQTIMPGTLKRVLARSSGELVFISYETLSSNSTYFTAWSSTDAVNFKRIAKWSNASVIQVTDWSIYIAGGSTVSKYEERTSKPLAPTISGPSVACVNEAAEFIAASNLSSEQLEWTFDGPGSFLATGLKAKATMSKAGTYSVGVRANDACGVSEYGYKTIEVKELAPPVIVGPTTVTAQSKANKYSVQQSQQGMWYGWSADKNTLLKVVDNEAIIDWGAPASGLVQLSQKDLTSLCRSTAILKVTITSGSNPGTDPGTDPGTITGVETPGSMSMYPNPSTGIVNISIPEGTTGEFLFFDQVGRQLKPSGTTAGASTMSYNLTGYPSGIYMVKVSLSTGQQLLGRVVLD